MSQCEGNCSGLLRDRVQSLEEEEAAHIVDDIGQANPHGVPGDAHGPDEQSRLRFLIGKDMPDKEPNDGLPGIGPPDILGHGLEFRLFPMNLRDEALLFHENLMGF